MIRDIVIIGAGPAGMTAALQLGRYGLNPLVLEKAKPGGLLNNARRVENYPGFPEGITGPMLVRRFREQILDRVKILHEKVLTADHKNKKFIIRTDHRTVIARVMIIATGTEPKLLPLAERIRGGKNLVFYEPSGMPKITGKTVAVVGSGDAAFDYALGLAARNKIAILGRGPKPRCLPVLGRQCRINANIKYRANIKIGKIARDRGQFVIRYNRRGSLSADYLLVAIGRRPNLDFLRPSIRNDRRRLVREKRLWLIGDVKNGSFRQAGISVGDGLRCAMEVAARMRNGRP